MMTLTQAPPRHDPQRDGRGCYLPTLIRLNREGIHSLKVQDCRTAVERWTNALELARQNLPGLSAMMSAEDNHPAPSSSLLTLVSVPIPKNPRSNNDDDDATLYLHTCALDLTQAADPHAPPSSHDYQNYSSNDTNTIITAMLFNLALACHLVGLQFQKDANLQKAFQLYDLCITRMVPRLSPQLHELHSMPLTLMCLNNQAHLQLECWCNTALARELATVMQRCKDRIDMNGQPQRLLLLNASQVGDMAFNAHVILNSKQITSPAA